MKTEKLTVDMALESEKQALLDALLDGSIELNDSFLDQFASDDVSSVLKGIPERDRAFYLEYGVDEDRAWFNGSPASRSDGIVIDVSEIEMQLDGSAEDYLAEPEEWTISGDRAYYHVGYGLSVDVDIDAVKNAWNDSRE